jgi:hypothetical protein
MRLSERKNMSGKVDKHIRKEVRKIRGQAVHALVNEIMESIYAKSLWGRIKFAFLVVIKWKST